jgi:ClpX C4-type zinc finger
MPNARCSFCGEAIAVPAPEDQPTLAVAGPKAFICRDCVGLCIEVMSDDPAWREQQLAVLTKSRTQSLNRRP